MKIWPDLMRRGSRREPPPRYAEDGPLILPPPADTPEPGAAMPAEASGLEERLEAAGRERDELAEQLSRLERMLADPELGENAILYYRLRELWDGCHRDLAAMAERCHAQYGQPGAPGEDLPLAKRRIINTLLIASAQEYCLAYREEQIAEMARLATHKPVEQATFGFAEECLHWQGLVRELVARVRVEENRSERLSARARYLHRCLRFGDDASRPFADSLNSIPVRIPDDELPLTGDNDAVSVNVLALDYWGLCKVLLP